MHGGFNSNTEFGPKFEPCMTIGAGKASPGREVSNNNTPASMESRTGRRFVTRSGNDSDVPSDGAGLTTMTGNAPPICSAFWGISPISVVALMKVVGISNVPTFIFAACLKPKPM
ncbi:MAG: hypothetical protein DMG14_30785, partial [Acidobacteria bacterium]